MFALLNENSTEDDQDYSSARIRLHSHSSQMYFKEARQNIFSPSGVESFRQKIHSRLESSTNFHTKNFLVLRY